MAKNLSIVTITYNDAHGLKKTGDSILMQKGYDLDQLEWIIVNGNPKNEFTLEVMDDFKAKGLVSWSQSKTDNGIYHAMNIGMKQATAPKISFLNSDDRLNHPKALCNLQPYLLDPEVDFIYTDYIYGEQPRQALDLKMSKYHMFTSHQAMIFDRNKIGSQVYDEEKYKIVSDFDFLTQYMKKVEHPVHVHDYAVRFALGGVSEKNYFETAKEYYAIRKENNVDLFHNLLWASTTVAGYFIRSLNPNLFTFLRSKSHFISEKSASLAEPEVIEIVYDKPPVLAKAQIAPGIS
jgi:glycosyltransferase